MSGFILKRYSIHHHPFTLCFVTECLIKSERSIVRVGYLVIFPLLSSHLCLSRFSITNVNLVFLSGCWELKSDPCAYWVSTLSTQPSPRSQSENYFTVVGMVSRLNINLKTQLNWNPSKFPPYWFRTYLLFRAGRSQRVGYLRWLPNKIGGRNKGQWTRVRGWKWENEI